MDSIVNLYEKFQIPMTRYAYSLCGDWSLSEDFVSDVFLAIMEGKTPTINTCAYLYQSVSNRVINHFRKYEKRIAPFEILDERKIGRYESLESQIEINLLMKNLAPLISKLTQNQRHAIFLRFIEGFSLDECSEILGKSYRAILSAQNSALANLKKASFFSSASVLRP